MADNASAPSAPTDSLPLVSVVTPSFNQAQFIEDTILSVLRQSYPRIEYVVIDGGSTDGTLTILQRYADRLRFVAEPDRGQSDAINKGWRMSHGNILAWLNSDDTYEPHAVETAVRLLNEHPEAGMVCGTVRDVDEQGNTVGFERSVAHDLHDILYGRQGWTIAQPTAFIRRSVIDEVGLLDETLEYCMDWDLWYRIAFRYPILYTDIIFADFRVWPGQKTSRAKADEDAKALLERDRLRIQRRYLGLVRYHAWRWRMRFQRRWDRLSHMVRQISMP